MAGRTDHLEGKGETEKLFLRSGDRLGEGEGEGEEEEEEVGGELIGDEREERTRKEFAPVKLREKSLSPKGITKIIFQLPFFKKSKLSLSADLSQKKVSRSIFTTVPM